LEKGEVAVMKGKKEVSILAANSHFGEEEVLFELPHRKYTMKVYSLEASLYRLNVT
jgi:hypothetical protein